MRDESAEPLTSRTDADDRRAEPHSMIVLRSEQTAQVPLPDLRPSALPRPARFRWSSPDDIDVRHSSLLEIEPQAAQLDPAILELLERCFQRLCGEGGDVIDHGELKDGLELRCNYLADRILSVLDADRDGLIDRDDFHATIRTLLCGSARERLSFAFRIHDLDGDAVLSRGELEYMIGLGLREDALEAPEREAARLTELLLRAADKDGDDSLSFDEFEAAVRKHASVFNQIARSGLVWIAPDDDVRRDVVRLTSGSRASWRERLSRSLTATRHKLENRAMAYALLAVWALAHVGLFARAMSTYAAQGAPLAVQVARGAGACLKLDAALILLPMLRFTLTRVRRSARLRALPIDDAPAFHRLLGHAILAFGLVHTVAHLYNRDPSFARPLAAIGEMKAGPTGLALLVGLGVLWVSALPRVRGAHFEAFHLGHLFYVAFFPLLFVHGKNFLAWGLVPCLAFAVDRGLRMLRHKHRSEVVTATALRSQVTRLEIARPEGFAHQPTDYVFLRVPEVSRHEWHPFTLSSAPERERLSVHVRSLGNWTRKLHALVAGGRTSGLEVELDGPYGAPCSHLFGSRHAVLIGAGIGATPFASVLESIALASQRGHKLGQLENVHFFWLNRDQKGFEWFRVLLASIERLDAGRTLDIRMHMTGGRNDAASALLSLARELSRAHDQRDLVTGLRAGTRMGHPDFAKELGRIAALYAPAQVAVYFCGPPGLARKVRAVCAELGMDFRQEHF